MNCPACQQPITLTVSDAGTTPMTKRFLVDVQHPAPVDPMCAVTLEASLVAVAQAAVDDAPGSTATVAAPVVEAPPPAAVDGEVHSHVDPAPEA